MVAAGTNLKVIARAGIGLDNVDVKAATQNGVMVVNAPTSNIVSAAELAVALMLAAARQRDELQLMGVTILTFTYRHVVDEPGWVVDSVRRARAVRVEAFDENGQAISIQARGWYARILQHEIDHVPVILNSGVDLNEH